MLFLECTKRRFIFYSSFSFLQKISRTKTKTKISQCLPGSAAVYTVDFMLEIHYKAKVSQIILCSVYSAPAGSYYLTFIFIIDTYIFIGCLKRI